MFKGRKAPVFGAVPADNEEETSSSSTPVVKSYKDMTCSEFADFYNNTFMKLSQEVHLFTDASIRVNHLEQVPS